MQGPCQTIQSDDGQVKLHFQNSSQFESQCGMFRSHSESHPS